jgi:outer membrane protein insertion porin family
MAVNKVLAASCLLACSVIGQAQAADAFTVKDIRIEGLQRVTLGAALLNLPIRVGDKLDSNASANAVKRLYSSGNFDDIKMLRDGDVLVVQVKERPTISQILRRQSQE